jgi:hypothetical protein
MFIISPRIGLCNQLQTIVKGLLLSIKYNRNIYIHKFQIDLYSNRLTDINHILNINKINYFLKNVIKTSIQIVDNLDIKITDNFVNYYLPNIDYTKIPTSSYINDDIELNKHMEIIYLGNIVSLDIYKSFNYMWDEYTPNNLYYYIMNNIVFHDTFYELKNYIKQELKLNKFSCIHLRIEDDAIQHFSSCYNLSINKYNENLIKCYDDNIKNISQYQNPIYISSGILKFNNTINLEYYKKLKNNNTLICDKQNINIPDYYLNNRELIAIIDLLIAIDSEVFVGFGISSFSVAVNTYHKYSQKPSTLLYITALN